MENIKETIAKDLLKIKAVFFSPEQPGKRNQKPGVLR